MEAGTKQLNLPKNIFDGTHIKEASAIMNLQIVRKGPFDRKISVKWLFF